MSLVEALQEQFSDSIQVLPEFRGETTLIVESKKIVEVCEYLKDNLQFRQLMDITGIDYADQNGVMIDPSHPRRFAAIYHLLSMQRNQRLRLKVYWDDGDEAIPSVTGVWSSANWEEREAYDMFGIEFSGHPDLRRLLMSADWQGYPQRKDYPLGYETVQFSFNFDEIQKHKPFAKE